MIKTWATEIGLGAMMIMVIIMGQSCVTSDVFGWFLFRVRLFEILKKVV